MSIFQTCLSNGITVEPQRVPRSENLRADYLSKNIDYEDLGITCEFFLFINNLSGPFDIDRFARFKNTKLDRFNSLFWNPGTEGVDCFSFSLARDNDWFVPPISLIDKCISHLITSNARGTIIVSKWPSSYFWPMFFLTKPVNSCLL